MIPRRALVRERLPIALVLVAACAKEPHASPKRGPSAAPPAPDASVVSPKLTADVASPAVSGRPVPSAPVVTRTFDAGVNACKLVFGPVPQPFVGDVALEPDDTGVLLVTHRRGIASVMHLAPTDAAAPSALDAGLPRASSPSCQVAAAFTFCMDPNGAIHRRLVLGESPDVIVARARPGTPFAAERLDGSHTVVAYLAERRTSEGIVSEAYASLDETPPIRLTEDGSGATFVALARRGPSLLALLLDGRVAMTPMHARSVAVTDGKLQLGEDAVVFVGGGAEASTRAAIGTGANGAAFGLMPVAGESGFGLAVVRLDDPPRMDEPSTWSPYLNGLDPAPIAATRGVTPIRVARVRPLEARADAARGLELGKLDDSGTFVPYGLVASKGRVTSAALAVDRTGLLWVAFSDGTGTWVERRACPDRPAGRTFPE